MADLYNDGRLAVVVNERHEKPSLLAPDGPAPNNWVDIQLIGTKSNRDGIGAHVEIEFERPATKG